MNVLIPVSLGAMALFLSGCVGTGPNTQQGAVTGGVLGAVAGAVLGHNSSGGDTFGGAILGGAAGAIAGGAIGNSVDHERGTVYGAEPRRVYRQVEPPGPPPMPPAPPASEVVTPSPAPNALWIPGYWNYQSGGYVWIPGHWEVPPPTASSYIAAHWEYRNGAYVFVPAYWR